MKTPFQSEKTRLTEPNKQRAILGQEKKVYFKIHFKKTLLCSCIQIILDYCILFCLGF
jgi:hypothetical protein